MKKFLMTMVILFIMSSTIYDVEAASVIGIIDGGIYDEDLTVYVEDADAIFLNGTEIEEGFIINEIGYHTIELYKDGTLQETIEFTIEPRFYEELEGESFSDSAIVKLENVGTMYVNRDELSNAKKFEEIGNYDVVIEGVNDYIKEFSFEINDGFLQMINGQEYPYNIRIDKDKFVAVYYDNQKMHSDLKLEKYGHYQIRVLGINNYYKTYNITLGVNTKYFYDGQVFENVNSIRVEQKRALSMYIDNKEQTGTVYINGIGNHTIKYVGLNGYHKTITVTLKEDPLEYKNELLDGNTYEYFQVNYSGYTLYINGKRYPSSTRITTIGDYKLTLVGKNNYMSDYTFRIWRDAELPEEGSVTNQAMNLEQDYLKIYVNGAKVENYRITETGEYEILLWGVGGYRELHTFTYVNEHETQAEYFLYIAISFSALTVLTYGFLAWRRFR